MKILIFGSGGREHTLVWKLDQSAQVDELVCAPGNAGIARHARCVPADVEDTGSLVELTRQEKPDLVVVGPERPLILGLVDELAEYGVPVYGPSEQAARLEGSKAFTDQLLKEYGISEKQFQVFDEPEQAKAYVTQQGAPIVVKADGDAFGKGVRVAETVEEAHEFIDVLMNERKFGEAGQRIVIEEKLEGQECSIIGFTDGKTLVPMVASQDHKPIGEGDTGPNTGGMGCYSPVPAVDDEVFDYCIEHILVPTMEAMAARDTPYVGTLYGGLILPESGPEVLEYNCRFGDPETQVILPRLESDLAPVLMDTATGELGGTELKWSEQACLCCVIASGGYPGKYEKGKPISGIDEAESDDRVFAFHAGTTMEDGQLVTDGGRVLGVTALGDDYQDAFERCYAAVEKIYFEDMYYRSDIGWRALQ